MLSAGLSITSTSSNQFACAPARLFNNSPEGTKHLVAPPSLEMIKALTPEKQYPHPGPRLINRLIESSHSRQGISDYFKSNPIAPNDRVEYFSLEQTRQCEMVFENGLAKSQDVLLGTADYKSKVSGSGPLIGVIVNKRFYVYVEKSAKANTSGPNIHHSSFTNGREVSSAFKLNVTEGIITDISNESGHYLPTATHLKFAVELLRHSMRQEDFSRLSISYIDRQGDTKKMGSLEFLERFNSSMPDHTTGPALKKRKTNLDT